MRLRSFRKQSSERILFFTKHYLDHLQEYRPKLRDEGCQNILLVKNALLNQIRMSTIRPKLNN